MRVRRVLPWWSFCVLGILIPACIGPPLIIAPEELPDAVEDSFYNQQLSTADGAIDRWRVAEGSLPSGLGLSATNGAIAGIPTTPGTSSFTVEAQQGGTQRRTGERIYAITVLPLLELEATLTAARVNVAYSATPSITGGVPPYTVEIVGLPAGLTYNTTTGVISGTPVNTYTGLALQINVTDSGQPQQTTTEQTTLVVKPPQVVITTTVLDDGQVGVTYSERIMAGDGRTPYAWAVTAGILPDGLRLDTSTGVISGAPTTAQISAVTIQVTDSDSPPTTDSVELTITIVGE